MLFGLVIGGMHSPAGAIVGGLFLQFFPDLMAGLGKGLSAPALCRAADRGDGGDADGIVGALEARHLLGARRSVGALRRS